MATTFYVLLPDYARKRIAVVQNGDGLALPVFTSQDDVRFNTVSGINSAVTSSWNIPVTVSRCLNPGENGDSAVFALHNHDENWKLPANAEWVDVSQLPHSTFDKEEQRLAVLDWLSSEKDDSWQNVPWSSPSWLAKATEWINKCVQSIGATVIGDPVQVRVWAISCVLRVSTTAGVFYFKASPHFWDYEPIVARYLLGNFPHYMVDVAAVEPEQHWMLTKEWAGSPPETREEWCKVLQVLREIQRHCDNRLDALLSLGCKNRRLEQLPTLLQPVFDELKQPDMRKLYGVNEEESVELARRLQLLPELCDKLGQYGITDTLIHGDLWGSNIIVRDVFSGKSPVIFDWTDAAISHPFFDIYCVLTSEKDDAKRSEEWQAHIDVWSEVLPHQEVVNALEVSERVAPYYYLLAYRNVELNTPVQSRWELLYLLHRFVHKILEAP
jgi:hypothetical protein